MKKMFLLFLILFLILGCSVAYAENMGVQVIGGDDSSAQPVSLDDIKLEKTIEIPGWCDITPQEFVVWDCVMVRKPGQIGSIWKWSSKGQHWEDDYNAYYNFDMEVTCQEHGNKDYPWWCEDWVTHYQSQSQADFAFLIMEILNTTTAEVDYLTDCTVKVVFDNTIEYAGWCYQRDMDLNMCTWISAEDNFVIEPYYNGHYVFGCTLPNAVFSSKKPLRMEITIDGNEIIYNVRK